METFNVPLIAVVILDQEIKKPLDYTIPEELIPSVKEGARVLVPLKNKTAKGTVLSLKTTSPFTDLKPLLSLLSQGNTSLPKDLLTLSEWMSSYYFASHNQVMRALLPPSLRKEIKPQKKLFIERNQSKDALLRHAQEIRNTYPDQARLLDYFLMTNKGVFLTDLIEELAISKSSVATLIKKNYLKSECLTPFSTLDCSFFPTVPKKLSEEQKTSLDHIKKSLQSAQFQTHLLFGVTGSGKTEIYLQAIEETLRLGKTSILLVPEIALTTQTVERLKSRFQRKIAILHHKLSGGERWEMWHAIQKKEILIAVGARSAIFCPMVDLGLIIVDEEHEPSYKQTEEPPCYHARDIAVMRGKITQSTVILGSATPSFESFHNTEKGKYHLSILTQRPTSSQLPSLHLIDMNQERGKGHFIFSSLLLDKIKERYEKGEQTLLFLNRRGFHTLQLCQKCKEVTKCPHCDLSLTHHFSEKSLFCHLCGFTLSPPPRECLACKSPDTLKFKGIGTEQVEKALKEIFPFLKTLRMDADTTKKKGSHDVFFKQFRSGKADVLIGTQMIAKGLHFPAVTLVGILNTDAALHLPDFRASEYLFQLAMQVSGRAGRGEIPGDVYLQTQMPDHPLFQFLLKQDYLKFYQQEIQTRRFFNFPPFTHLIRLIFFGADESLLQDAAKKCYEFLISSLPPQLEIHPPIPCGHAKIKDTFRFHLLIKTPAVQPLKEILPHLRKQILPKEIKCLIDVDPTSTYY